MTQPIGCLVGSDPDARERPCAPTGLAVKLPVFRQAGGLIWLGSSSGGRNAPPGRKGGYGDAYGLSHLLPLRSDVRAPLRGGGQPHPVPAPPPGRRVLPRLRLPAGGRPPRQPPR